MVAHSSPIETTYEVHLPFPPSINAMYRTVGKRLIRSRQYRDWIAAADGLAISQKLKINQPLGKFSAQIHLSDAHRKNRDVDNHAKCILDWAQSRGLIHNDRLAEQLTVSWVPSTAAPEGCRLVVRGGT